MQEVLPPLQALPSPVSVPIRRGRRLRACVVGLGKQALEDHLPGVLAADDTERVPTCDENVVGEQERALQVTGCSNIQTMLSDQQLDFMVVCVSRSDSRKVIETSAAASVHALKEKPFATSLAEATLCERLDLELMATLQRRLNPIYTSFMQLADQIGRPFVIDAAYTLHVDAPSAATSQIDHFCHVIRGDRANLSSPQDNVAHLAVVVACYESTLTGRHVNPKELM